MTPDIFNHPAMWRMGWALLHFLWQGTLIALALKGTLMLVKQRASRLRYALALACLFMMAASPVFLLCRQQGSNPDIPAAHGAVPFEEVSVIRSTSSPIPMDQRPDFRLHISPLVAPLVPWITACWLLGMALLLLKTMGGVLQVRALKRAAAAHGDSKGTPSFRALAARAGIAGVPILETGLVTVPTVAGWLKPVVLLPKGVSEQIDCRMLEALVAHELAHVRRHDSAVNLLQTVIENLLFFHPATWWVARNVRAEREACCDDDAVAICGDALVYVRALSQAEQFRSSMPVIALSSSPLLQRIRRLTEMRISKMNHAAAFCVALLAIFFIIATAVGSIVLATIPPQSAASGVSAGTPGGDQASGKAGPEAQGTQPQQGGKYTLVCGIVFVKTDAATGKPVISPPLQEDGKSAPGGCILFDASAPKPSRVPGELQPSRLIQKVDPIYPEAAIKEHVGIRVMLHLDVSVEGQVTDVEVAKSQTVPPDRDSQGKWVGGVRAGIIKGISSAAVNAVKQWKYSPTLLNGRAVPVMATASIDFTFNKDGSPKIVTYGP